MSRPEEEPEKRLKKSITAHTVEILHNRYYHIHKSKLSDFLHHESMRQCRRIYRMTGILKTSRELPPLKRKLVY
jgi:hypothetical protein